MCNHIPVLLQEAINSLNIQDNCIYVDATFGAGGYSREILNRNKTCKVIAFDRDINVKKIADNMYAKYPTRFTFINDNFSTICNYVKYEIDGVVFDLGVSSMQIDNAERGFSYMKDGILDMRMNKSDVLSAKDIVNNFSETDLSNIFYNYGEEFKSRYIAKKIIYNRKIKPILTTFDLVNIISESVPHKYRIGCIKRVFQSLRIYINDELNELQIALKNVSTIIKSGGVLSVVSFHSLEDRIVKNFFRFNKDLFKKIQKDVILPTKQEIQDNLRSASSKLRYSEKI